MEYLADSSLLARGGVVIWIIAALSVLGLAVILWIFARLIGMAAWGGAKAEAAISAFQSNGTVPDEQGGGVRLAVVRHAISAMANPDVPASDAREEAERVARQSLAEARRGLRVLDVIATVAPLLGLLGTVLGMISAFQALQDSGAQADPSVLAGGIWEALLTTAAGMAVAIPAAMVHAWVEGIVDRIAIDLEDMLTRVFLAKPETALKAAE